MQVLDPIESDIERLKFLIKKYAVFLRINENNESLALNKVHEYQKYVKELEEYREEYPEYFI